MISYDPDKDAYAILGVAADADRDEVEAAYRRAALQWHPDKSTAPDAAERFRDVQEAAEILRKPWNRRDYDRLRTLHVGMRWRQEEKQRQQERERGQTHEAWVPMAAPPAWIAPGVRVVRDAVHIMIESRPKSALRELASMLAFMALGAAIVTADLGFVLLAVLAYVIVQVQAKPPQAITIGWAKLVPGRRLAEYTVIDQRLGALTRHEVPFSVLQVGCIQQGGLFSVVVLGFPKGPISLMEHTRDAELARRRARDASQWLGLPLARAA